MSSFAYPQSSSMQSMLNPTSNHWAAANPFPNTTTTRTHNHRHRHRHTHTSTTTRTIPIDAMNVDMEQLALDVHNKIVKDLIDDNNNDNNAFSLPIFDSPLAKLDSLRNQVEGRRFALKSISDGFPDAQHQHQASEVLSASGIDGNLYKRESMSRVGEIGNTYYKIVYSINDDGENGRKKIMTQTVYSDGTCGDWDSSYIRDDVVLSDEDEVLFDEQWLEFSPLLSVVNMSEPAGLIECGAAGMLSDDSFEELM